MIISRTPVRDALTCLVCHKPGPGLDIDHIVNRGMGGSEARDVPENKAPLCRPCHELKTNNKIETWVDTSLAQWFYYWRRVDLLAAESPPTIRIPVRVDKRHGCLVPRDAAEQTDGSGPELVEGSASSPGAEGPPSAVPATDAGDDPLNGRQSPGQRPAPGVRKRQPSAPNVAGGEDAVLEQGVSNPPALMVGEGEASQFLVVTPPSVDTPRVNVAAPRPSPSPASLEDWLTQDWSVLTDDELQTKYDAAEKMQGFAYLLRCKALYAYRENHVQAWGESWTEQAIERFGISRRTCQAQANIWEICVRRDAYTEIAPLTDSRSLMQAIGRQSVEKGVETMEAAIAYFAEYAEPPTVKALVQEEQPERERHACPLCNFSHWVVVESEWKT